MPSTGGVNATVLSTLSSRVSREWPVTHQVERSRSVTFDVVGSTPSMPSIRMAVPRSVDRLAVTSARVSNCRSPSTSSQICAPETVASVSVITPLPPLTVRAGPSSVLSRVLDSVTVCVVGALMPSATTPTP